MSWLIWVGVVLYIINKGSNSLREMLEDHQETAEKEFEEADSHSADRDKQLRQCREESMAKQSTPITVSDEESTSKGGYQKLDIPPDVEGGKLMVEDLNDEGQVLGNSYTGDILQSIKNKEIIQATLRTAIITKEILDRKYE